MTLSEEQTLATHVSTHGKLVKKPRHIHAWNTEPLKTGRKELRFLTQDALQHTLLSENTSCRGHVAGCCRHVPS